MKQFIWTAAAVCTIALCGCASAAAQPSASASASALSFKEEYEALNGTVNSAGKENRTVAIPEDNPFVLTTAEEIVKKAEAGDTFYVLYSDPLCPWCRSVIETACSSAKANGIQTIYAVDIWDDSGNEILRDKYQLKDGRIEKVMDGTEAYQKTLTLFDSVLADYTLSDANGTSYSVGEKRIYAPNFIYVKAGKAAGLTEGISDLQKDARETLTDAVLADEKNIFDQFFTAK
jgi:hypothetical protein